LVGLYDRPFRERSERLLCAIIDILDILDIIVKMDPRDL